MVNSIDAEKAIEKIQTHLRLKKKKTSPENGNGICLNIIKTIYEKNTDNIIFNGENLKAFSL